MKKIVIIVIFCIFPVTIFAGDNINDIIGRALALEGTPYLYGGASPSGFDCSGFISFLFKGYVPNLPRISRNMAHFGQKVKRSNLKAGDLVFFATGQSKGVITHVALYTGNNTIVHAVSQGPQTGVIVTNINTVYWKKRYTGAVRVIDGSKETASRSQKKQPWSTKNNHKTSSASNSPWNTFDGIIEGDFNLYLEKEKNDFEKWKKNNQ